LPLSLRELAELTGATIRGDPETPIRGVAGLRNAREGEIALLADPKYARHVAKSAASALVVGPDFGVMDPTAMDQVTGFYNTAASFNINSGSQPRNANILTEAFHAIQVQGMTLVEDQNFGGSTGYIDGAAAEEILVGNSKALQFVTTSSRKQGLVYPKPVNLGGLVTGELGVFKMGPFAFVINDPKKFALAYT